MNIRDAIIDDLPAIVEIYNSTIASRKVTADLMPISVKDKEAWFFEHNNSNRPLWVCENEFSEIIGWISFQDFYGRPAYKGTAEISIYFSESFRGKGFGKKAMEHTINACPNLSIHTLLGFIFEQNKESIKLFSSFGFEKWGHLPNVALLDNNYCNLLIMGKKIA